MKVAIACDHGAFAFKSNLIKYLQAKNHTVEDFGTNSEESCDYPDYGVPAARSVAENSNDRAILVCTNGIGMSMAANKIESVRAALVYSVRTAETTRKHHDSNVLCLGAGEFSPEELLTFIDAWMTTDFEGGRHARRVSKFPKCGA